MKKTVMLLLSAVLITLLVSGVPTKDKVNAQPDGVEQIAAFGGRGVFSSLAWSPDSTQLATSGFGGVYLYDETLDDAGYLQGADGFIGTIGWSSDSSLVAGAISTDRTIGGIAINSNTNIFYVWDVASGEIIQEFSIPADVLAVEFDASRFGNINDTQHFVFSADTQRLAVVSSIQASAFISVWEINSGALVNLQMLPSARGEALQVVWSPSNDQIAYIERDSVGATTVTRWNLEDDLLMVEIPDTTELDAIEWNSEGIHVRVPGAVVVLGAENLATVSVEERSSTLQSPDGMLRAEFDAAQVRILSTTDRKVVDTIDLDVESRFGPRFTQVFWTPENKLVALVDRREFQVYVWSADQVGQPAIVSSVLPPAVATAVSPDRRFLTAGLGGGSLVTVDVSTGEIVGTRVVSIDPYPAFALHPTEPLVATGQTGGGPTPVNNLLIWDIQRERLAFEPSQNGFVYSIAWSPNGGLLAIGNQSHVRDTGSRDPLDDDPDTASVSVWATPTDRVEQFSIPSYPADFVYRVRWSRDSTKLAAVKLSNLSGITMLYVWDVLDRDLLWEQSFNTYDVAWTTDGNLVAVGADETGTGAVLKLFDGQTGEELAVTDISTTFLERHTIVLHPANPDLLVYQGSTLQLITLHTGEILLSQDVASGTYRPVAFSPDGQYIATESSESLTEPSIVIYKISLDDGTLDAIATLSGYKPNPFGIIGIDWKGTTLAAMGGYGDVIVWDTSNVE